MIAITAGCLECEMYFLLMKNRMMEKSDAYLVQP